MTKLKDFREEYNTRQICSLPLLLLLLLLCWSGDIALYIIYMQYDKFMRCARACAYRRSRMMRSSRSRSRSRSRSSCCCCCRLVAGTNRIQMRKGTSLLWPKCQRVCRVFTRKFTLSFVASEIVLLHIRKSVAAAVVVAAVASCKLQVAINKVLYYAHSHLAAHPTTAARPPPHPPVLPLPLLLVVLGGMAIIAHCAEKLVFATSHFHDFQSRSILIENIFKC